MSRKQKPPKGLIDQTNKTSQSWDVGFVWIWSEVFNTWVVDIYRQNISIRPGESGKEAYVRQNSKPLPEFTHVMTTNEGE